MTRLISMAGSDNRRQGAVIVMGFVAGIGATLLLSDCVLSLKSAYMAGDLDNNGIQDIVVVQGQGAKVPMFGVDKGDGRTYYYTAGIMREIYPDSIFDYGRVERLIIHYGRIE
ncbi:hypothetical protein HY640_01970 [Candidatus Woesearchaeota archaeon]|nr:hypothetical protein [Candidatus Woesearchaeota archaeon]